MLVMKSLMEQTEVKMSSVHFSQKFFKANGGEDMVLTHDDLGNKFNISDLYDYFRSGILSVGRRVSIVLTLLIALWRRQSVVQRWILR